MDRVGKCSKSLGNMSSRSGTRNNIQGNSIKVSNHNGIESARQGLLNQKIERRQF